VVETEVAAAPVFASSPSSFVASNGSSAVADIESSESPAAGVPFALEPAVMAPAETAAIGAADTFPTPEAVIETDAYQAPAGLFDVEPAATADEQAIAMSDPADAAANAIAQQSDDISTEAGREDRQNA
jgi:hypothetical protein